MQYKNNLGLYTTNGKYNIMAQLLSDNSHIPVRVAIFSGTSKADNMYSVREFGNQCLLYSLNDVLRYGDVLNIIQADEKDRIVERKEVPLFDNDAFREAIINAFLGYHSIGLMLGVTNWVIRRVIKLGINLHPAQNRIFI